MLHIAAGQRFPIFVVGGRDQDVRARECGARASLRSEHRGFAARERRTGKASEPGHSVEARDRRAGIVSP